MRSTATALVLSLSCVLAAQAQTGFTTIPSFPIDTNPLVIRKDAMPSRPFSVTGERGAILGQQDGTFELWLLPVKILHQVHLTAKLKDYDTVIDLNAHASSIEVRPDHTTITYAHAAITVKQHMFIPQGAEAGLADAVILFEIHASRPAELTLSFAPSMERQWPAPNFGRPSANWIPSGTGGAYSLETDNPDFYGMVAMPNAQHGPIPPYQERPVTTPVEFRISYDPAKDDHTFYPLLCGLARMGETGSAGRAALLNRLTTQNRRLIHDYQTTAEHYSHFFDHHLTVSTPDKHFDEALRWAEISIEESKVSTANGAGLAGGWFTSGDSARPGFGWFFGRDTLWTLYAVNSFGDFAMSRQALDFLLAHQRADGKMMHEYSQTAPEVDWNSLPYLYASADSTPLFVMQMEDYIRTSGDLAYLKQHWDNVKRAYAFTRSHTTDGVYDNTQGTGWVEEWPRMPHQEIYLAALDQQSAESYSRLADLMGETEAAQQAMTTASAIKEKLAGYRGADGSYRFSRNVDGSYEDVPSIFPAVAWWSGHLALPQADETFTAWAGHGFSTDWGIRSVAKTASIYDPISYHHGSVWPLYTGWTSMAEYRSGRPVQAFSNLRNTAELTWLQDPGAITEVLSGDFFEPLGRSSSHQLWSSAMVLTPAIRGLFGLEADALNHTLRVAPQLPAAWDHVSVQHVAVGEQSFDVTMQRVGRSLEIDATSGSASMLCLVEEHMQKPCDQRPAIRHRLMMDLPPVEIGLEEILASEGDSSKQMKVLDERREAHRLTVKVEAPAGITHRLTLRTNGVDRQTIAVSGGTLDADGIVLNFPAVDPSDPQYVSRLIELKW
ncbi:amylo-alpha-1,6-glucosidase [Granulicella arctica]|uniref:Mannosylglycerate hydrolase MGH1-like glycoside hydrolase domain-containing protein n=1 Tax=Granulicella arctica TaxID=940613 RepID=A0A7Y9PGC7_9BACT|nr:glycogen debranching protein [Granulicella arctica]NYF79381.1 hypothetical protein [Granulicella arctica]